MKGLSGGCAKNLRRDRISIIPWPPLSQQGDAFWSAPEFVFVHSQTVPNRCCPGSLANHKAAAREGIVSNRCCPGSLADHKAAARKGSGPRSPPPPSSRPNRFIRAMAHGPNVFRQDGDESWADLQDDFPWSVYDLSGWPQTRARTSACAGKCAEWLRFRASQFISQRLDTRNER